MGYLRYYFGICLETFWKIKENFAVSRARLEPDTSRMYVRRVTAVVTRSFLNFLVSYTNFRS
jgi:hypothetical protein